MSAEEEGGPQPEKVRKSRDPEEHEHVTEDTVETVIVPEVKRHGLQTVALPKKASSGTVVPLCAVTPEELEEGIEAQAGSMGAHDPLPRHKTSESDEDSTHETRQITKSRNSRLTFKESVRTVFSLDERQDSLTIPLGLQRATILKNVCVVVLSGVMFGYALAKGGVAEPRTIRAQMDWFSDNSMLLMFLTATSTSVAIITFMRARSGAVRRAVSAGGQKYLHSKEMGLVAVIIGSFMTGVGMTMTGTCPGTIWANLGTWNPTTFITFAGGVSGAGAMGLLYPYLTKLMKYMTLKDQQRHVPSLLKVHPFVTAGGLVVFMMAVVGVVGAFAHDHDFLPWNNDVGIFQNAYWHPVVAGLMLGSLQIPLSLGYRKNLGASTSFQVLAAHVLWPVKYSEAFNKMRKRWGPWWSVCFVSSAVIGSLISTLTSEPQPWAGEAEINIITPWEAFFGGVIGLFGSRLASGCTSGHGITGMGHQSLTSFCAVGAIFGGGLLTSAVFYCNNSVNGGCGA